MPIKLRSRLALAIIAPWLSVMAHAQSLDPHEIYERTCSRCHDAHGGNFAKKSLDLVAGKVVGRKNSRQLRDLLEGGHGGLSSDETDALVAHFESIVSSGHVYQDKCTICHDRAVVVARRNLIVRDGRLMGRYSHKDIAKFLENHGRLEPDEIVTILDMFHRQLN